MTKTDDSLLTFPCQYSIKVMGEANSEFETEVYSIITQHVDTLKENAIRTRPSKNNRYLSITIAITATSREQLDKIYQALTDSKLVLMAL